MESAIKQTKKLHSVLQYNERKLNHGKAECLLAANFVKDLPQLTKTDKLDRFLQRTSLNERPLHNVVHISLSFDTTVKISNEQMGTLATRYMIDMGLEGQPYLVYRHYDSGHPHCHIVTTNILANGNIIALTKTEYWESQKITKKLAQEFNLPTHESIKPGDEEKFKVRQAQRVLYGQSALKHSISDVLNTVIDHYRYTSLRELNAILRLYNVKATRGHENSHLYQKKGLLYHALDQNGKRKGKSIKASDFLLRPTLANLEKKFFINETHRSNHRQRVKTAIDWALAGTPPDWNGFKQALEKEGIHVVMEEDKKDGSQSIFFVDHESKCVFGGENLGQAYMLEAIREKCSPEQNREDVLEENWRQRLRLE